jgi:hypothetical protein
MRPHRRFVALRTVDGRKWAFSNQGISINDYEKSNMEANTMPVITGGLKNATTLEIVLRNPNPVSLAGNFHSCRRSRKFGNTLSRNGKGSSNKAGISSWLQKPS